MGKTKNNTNKDEKFQPVYVIAGRDAFFAGNELARLLEKLLGPEPDQMSLLILDANNAEAADVFDELRTLPFLSKIRVVVIKQADDFITANRKLLERYFENPSDTGVLIMTVSSWRSNTKLAAKLEKVGKLISIGEIKPNELSVFAGEYCTSRHGKQMNSTAAKLLVELVGDDPGRLAGEIDKLATYVGQAKAITAQDIEKLVGHGRIYGAFDVIDAMIAGKTDQALGKLRMMFEMNRDARYTVIGAFAYHFRKMFAARSMLEKGMNEYAIAKKAGIWENQQQFFGQIRRVSIEQLAGIICELAQIDYKTKTGQATAQSAVTNLVVRTAKLTADKALEPVL